MPDSCPEHDEILQAADLSASKADVRKTPGGRGKSLLLAICLLIWSGAVFVFFTRPPTPGNDRGKAMVSVTATPLPDVQPPAAESRSEPLAVPPTPQPEKRIVKVKSHPPGARVLMGDTFIGQTPFDLENPENGKSLWFQLSGYESVRVSLDQEKHSQELVVELPPLRAKVWLEILPKDSRIYLDGELKEAPQEGYWSLPLRNHELKVEAGGYETQTVQFIPAQAYERKIKVTLSPEKHEESPSESAAGETAVQIPLVQGLEMILPVFPIEATLGSARGTAGRQSNELQIRVKLDRIFSISKTEITNAQFRRFRPEHNSGRWKGVDLNGDALPVSGVSWEDAVEYCNWLSAEAGLAPAYVLKDERWEYQEKPGTGYRLPTEAEWESVARLTMKQALFGWGDEMPPPQATVNVAGKESAKQFPHSLSEYSDRFAGPAPVDQAGEGPLGLLGLYGNVCEWVQDGYSIPPVTSRVWENPLNAAAGEFHVMKGASWQDSGIGDLRMARRRYGKQSAPDLGFRVARYLQPPSGENR